MSDRFGLLSYPGIANLGDVIQSLAARRFLPRVDALIERERISRDVPGGPFKTILNGWYMHDAAQWPPSAVIEPLPISMHFTPSGPSRLRRWAATPIDRMLSGAGADYLRRCGPVGARDPSTLRELEARGIPAYLSGCLTLTLQPGQAQRGEHIAANDLPPAVLDHLRRRAGGRPIVETTHLGGEKLDHAAQEAAAEHLLDTYRTAAAVITTRIHAALPCLAFGTPVLLVHASDPPARVRDTALLVRSCGEADFLRDRYDIDWSAPSANPPGFTPLAEALVAACRGFTGFDRGASRSPPDGAPAQSAPWLRGRSV